MKPYPDDAIEQLCQHLQVDALFFKQCIQESAIELLETDQGLDLSNGTAFRLRRLQRLCRTFDIDLPVATLLWDLTRRVAELENELRRARLTHQNADAFPE